MANKGDDLYGTFGSVPTQVAENGTGGGMISARATPESFGAGVGEAVSGAGKEALDISQKYQGLAAEARVNDDYANKYVPKAISLRNQYDMLDSKDKAAGYQTYIGNLQELNKQFTSSQPSFYGQKIMSSQINRHIEGETEGANRELVASQIKYEAESKIALQDANTRTAATPFNYNNNNYAQNIVDQNNSIIALHHADESELNGKPYNADLVAEKQRLQQGSTSVARINTAIGVKDIGAAYDILRDNSHTIPAGQQLHLGNVLGQESLNNAGYNGVKSLTAGDPIPDAHGYPPYQVQASVADAAHKLGIDASQALTVAKIESNYGQSVGTRGDIGQTGKGGDINEQSINMVTALKSAGQAAKNALGRDAQPWEQYLCYQQGNTGGSALLKAATENPNASAISVISTFYKTQKEAMTAITHNGGTASMTSGDFSDFIKQKYNDNAAMAQCTIPQGQSAGDVIRDAHNTTIPAIQQGAMTPKQALTDFNRRSEAILAQINNYPIGARRDAMFEAFNQLKGRYEGASNRYTQQIVDNVQQKMADPKFNINQVTPEEMAELSVNHPQAITEMRNRSEAVEKYGYEQAAKIADVNSANFLPNLKRTLAVGTDNQLRTENQVHELWGRKDNTGTNAKDTKDLNSAINDLPDQFKMSLLKKVNAVEAANGNVDNAGGNRATDFYFQAAKLYRDNESKQTGKLPPVELDKQIDALMAPHTPSRIDQITNLSKSMAQQNTATAATPADTIMVTSPDGRRGRIPSSQLQDAIKSGYKQVQ